ncbi:MAG: hypothetical protein D6712_17300, partial [Chloroflexi bacterium]
MSEPHDTQPRLSPVDTQQTAAVGTPVAPPPNDIDDLQEAGNGPGCFIWGFVMLFTVILAVVVVVLAALAGWASGQPIAQQNATASVEAIIVDQCTRLAAEVAAENDALLGIRMEYLLTQTPAVPCVQEYIPVATALYSTKHAPTATPTFTPTPTQEVIVLPTFTPTTEGAAPVPTIPVQQAEYDLDELMQEVQQHLDLAEWNDAIALLEAIQTIDPTYRVEVVNNYMFQALTSRARELYLSGQQLAEAILLTDRAEALGDIGDLAFERIIAQLWLDAQRNLTINYPEAIRLLSEIYRLAPNYRGGEAANQLFSQRVAYGDALLPSDPCRAVTQYEAALTLRSDVNVQTKRDEANLACSNFSLTQQA